MIWGYFIIKIIYNNNNNNKLFRYNFNMKIISLYTVSSEYFWL